MYPQLPENLEFDEHYACFRPVGEVSLQYTVEKIDEVLSICIDRQVEALMVNITALDGFSSPSLTDRFTFISKWSATNKGRVIFAMVAPAEMIDREKIGVTMARNRGMRSDVFAAETEAIAWILQQLGKSY